MRKFVLIAMSTIMCTAWLVVQVQAGTIKGRVTCEKAKWLPDVVVYVDSAAGPFTPPEKHPVMNQKNLVFHPHVLPVLTGTTVDFLNSDDVAHNVFSPDETAGKFNLGTWPTGETRSYTFSKHCPGACSAVMLCNVHPEMEAFVVMFQNPYFAMIDDSGYYAIESVPAGSYTLKLWHPKGKAESQTIEVTKDGVAKADLVLKK